MEKHVPGSGWSYFKDMFQRQVNILITKEGCQSHCISTIQHICKMRYLSFFKDYGYLFSEVLEDT